LKETSHCRPLTVLITRVIRPSSGAAPGQVASSQVLRGEKETDRPAESQGIPCPGATLARNWTATVPPSPSVRASLLPPAGHTFTPNDFAVSPDGRRVAFVAAGADGVATLWVSSLQTAQADELARPEARHGSGGCAAEPADRSGRCSFGLWGLLQSAGKPPGCERRPPPCPLNCCS